jgi:spoIIIJ-associated protein
VAEKNGHYRANIETPEAGKLIGPNGATLNALQILLKNVLYHQTSERLFVSVDVDSYRAEQDDRFLRKVQESIEMMKDQNLGELKLSPMKPYLRRLVHLWIPVNYPDLATSSIGDGDNRAIKVFHK